MADRSWGLWYRLISPWWSLKNCLVEEMLRWGALKSRTEPGPCCEVLSIFLSTSFEMESWIPDRTNYIVILVMASGGCWLLKTFRIRNKSGNSVGTLCYRFSCKCRIYFLTIKQVIYPLHIYISVVNLTGELDLVLLVLHLSIPYSFWIQSSRMETKQRKRSRYYLFLSLAFSLCVECEWIIKCIYPVRFHYLTCGC